MKSSRIRQAISLVAVIGLGTAVSQAAPGSWQEPTHGWGAVYDASSGLLPWDLSGSGTAKTWTNQVPRDPSTPGYGVTDPASLPYAGLGTDSITGEPVMIVKNNGQAATAQLNAPPGSGSAGDLMTVDVRFRLYSDLPDDTTDSALPSDFPLYIDIVRPPNAAQLAANSGADEQFIQIRLRKQKVYVLGMTGTGSNTLFGGTTPLNNDWVDMRILWDTNGSASIYLNGSTTPELTDIFPRINTTIPAGQEQNTVSFGASGSGVTGQTSIAYVKITSGELAPVAPIPEPAALALLAAGTPVLLLRRSRATRGGA